MKTKIFLASALLFAACFATASADDYYLIGEYNNWNENETAMEKFTSNGNGTYTLTKSFNGLFKLKKKVGDTWNWVGAKAESDQFLVNYANPTATIIVGGGSDLNIELPATYTLTISDNDQLTVTGFPTSGYFIVGTFNNWKAEQMVVNSDGSYSFTRSFVAGERFKIRDYQGTFYGGEVKQGDQYHGINDLWRTYISVQYNAGEDFIFQGTPGECTIIFTNDQKLTVLGYGHPKVTLSDATNDLSSYSGQTVDVVINGRTLYKDGAWNTICLPFGYTNGYNGTLFNDATAIETLTSSSFADGTLTLNFESSTITAGKPYLVKWNSASNIVNPMFTNVTISATSPSSFETDYATFQGCFSQQTIAGKEYLFLGDANKVYYPDPSYSVGAFRGYFQLLNGVIAGDPTSPNGIKAFVLNFGDDTNSIQTISNETSSNDGYFTLDGRRLNDKPATAGLYIINGKKVVIK